MSCTNKPNSFIFVCRFLCCISYCHLTSPGFLARLSTVFALIYFLPSHWGLGVFFPLCFLLSDIPLSLVYPHWLDFTFSVLKEGDGSIAISPISLLLPVHCLLQFKALAIYHGRLCPRRAMTQGFRWNKSLEKTLLHWKAPFCNVYFATWQLITASAAIVTFSIMGCFFPLKLYLIVH